MKKLKKDVQKQLGPIVSGLLKKRAQSQSEVAAKVGMSAPQICNFLNGKTDIHASRFVEILNTLGIDVLRLIRLEAGMDPAAGTDYHLQLSLMPDIEKATLKTFFKAYKDRLKKDSLIA